MKMILCAALCAAALLGGNATFGQTPAAKDQVRHIDFTQPLHDLDGKPLMDVDKPVTLGRVAALALTDAPQHGEKVDQVGDYDLAMRVYHAKDAVLTVKDTALLVERVTAWGARGRPAFVVGQALEMLDPALSKGER
jgi:hypothetical protein